MVTKPRAVVVSLVACLGVATVGNVAVVDALAGWYSSLRQPAFGLPLAGWIVVGIVYYLLMATVLYRVLRFVRREDGRSLALTLVGTVLIGNELWNAVFFGLRSPAWGLVALIVFLVPVTALWLVLRRRDVPAGRLVAAYLAWVVLYDLPWLFALWRLNLGS